VARQRQIDVRKAGLLAIAALATVTVAASGCGKVSTQPHGAWAGCGNLARPSVMQVRRTVALARPMREILLATERRAPVVRRLFHDMCVIAAHPANLPPGATLSCPDDFGLTYSGVFEAGNKTLATFTYHASGCNALSLSAGPNQASSLIWSKAALAVQPSLDAGLATAFGVRADAIHQYTFPRRKPPTAVELRQFLQAIGTAHCTRLHGYPHRPGSTQEHGPPVPAGMGTGQPQLQAAARACGLPPYRG
jgi:hypothetical protein